MFVAYYSKARLLGLAALGLLFVALGVLLIVQPPGSFDHSAKIVLLGLLLGGNTDLAGHGLGWVTALLGLAVLPVVARQMTYRDPVIRIDDKGIYWHRWSAKPIAWSNVSHFAEKAIRRQRFVSLTLHDPALDPSSGLLAGLGRINKAMGFGHVSLTVQGTNRSHQELAEAVRHHAARHERYRGTVVREQAPPPPEQAGPRRPAFGRKGA